MTPLLYRIRNTLSKKYDTSLAVTTDGRILDINTFLYIKGEERFIIERCTGMKDTNNKLIYEGDIVLYGAGLHNNTEHIVIYEDGIWKISIPGLSYAVEFKYLEVVGNIHN